MNELVRPSGPATDPWRSLLAAATWLVALAASPAAAGAESSSGRGELPPAVAQALREAQIPTTAVALVVAPVDGGPMLLALNESTPMNPASTMKLLTTYAALNLLGPTFQWQTEALATQRPSSGVLNGDLILRGSGDP